MNGARDNAAGWRVRLALLTIYVVWGSTYLAIRVMDRTIPPLLGSGMRFLVAGVALAAFVAARRGLSALTLTRRELGATALMGVLLPVGGNGLVTVAERDIPSGLAALLIASVPLWVVLLRRGGGERVGRATLGGVALGFAGVLLLVSNGSQIGATSAVGVVLVLVAALTWAIGSYASPALSLPRDPLTSTAAQMVWGGAILSVAGLIAGETSEVSGAISGESLLALAYLITVGAIVAYSAYNWLLANAPVTKVSTYAYVNPAIAVVLGWAILGETIVPATIAGAVLIVLAVAFIVGPGARRTAARADGRIVGPVRWGQHARAVARQFAR